MRAPTMADGIGDALLDAAIKREVDGFAVGLGKLAERNGDMGIGVTVLEAGDQLIEQLRESDPAEGSGP